MDLILLASLGSLAVGPVVAELAGRAPRTRAGLDGFVTVTIAGLVLVHILPHAITLGGGWALGAAVAGLVIPVALHRMLHQHGHDGHDGHDGHGHAAARSEVNAAFVFALNALAVHALLDGVAIAGWKLGDEGSVALAGAVVLHRLPAAMAIWWVARPRIGSLATVGILSLVGVATWLGYAGLSGGVAGAGLGIFQALMAGSLLHVTLDHAPGQDAVGPGPGRAGAMCGVLVLVILSALEVRDPQGAFVPTLRFWAELAAAGAIGIWVASRR